MAVLLGCPEPPTVLRRSARVEGRVAVEGSPRGDAYLFLFAPDEAPPEGRGSPRYVTAVSDVRRAAGDARYLFAEVAPDAYRLWGFLDVNGDADLAVDVLAQPGAGDYVPEASVEVNVQPGQVLPVELALPKRLLRPLPAFRVVQEGEGGVVSLPDTFTGLVSVDVRSEGFGLVQGEPPRFFVRLADANGDGTADDVDGDGIVDLWPRFFLRFVPRPGQTVPVSPQGKPAEVIVPFVVDPTPFLSVLQGDVSQAVAAETLRLFLVPLAQAITQEPGKGRVVTALGAVPVGDYELWAVTEEGSAWFVPNALGRRTVEPVVSQGLRFQVVH